ncbi:MAG: hypothetical protein ACFB20_01725 [Opitutales bacterium]
MSTDAPERPLANLWGNLRCLLRLMRRLPPDEFSRQLNSIISPNGQTLFDATRQDLRKAQTRANFAVREALYEPDPWLREARDRHRGERCFLLGCGPSLKNLDTSLLRGERVMATNGAFLLEGIEPDYYMTVSHYFFRSHLEAIRNLGCARRFLPLYLHELHSDSPTTWLNTVEADEYGDFSPQRPLRFSDAPHERVFLGGTVIFACLQILYYLGFEEVILLGVDHSYASAGQQERKDAYWIDSQSMQDHFMPKYYKEGTQVNIDMPAMDRAYTLSVDTFRQDGRRLLNATPGTKLEIIPKIDLEAVTSLGSTNARG